MCYESKLDPNYMKGQTDERIKVLKSRNVNNLKIIYQLMNSPYSWYGRKCKHPGQHGLEIRVCARRVSFFRDNVKNNYRIDYKIRIMIGFSYSYKSFFFEKNETIFGKINKTNGKLDQPLKENTIVQIVTIQLGKNDTNFAILTDINGNILDYSSNTMFLINKLFDKKGLESEKTLQSIAEGNEALPLLGLDMNHEESNLLKSMEFPEMPCHFTIKFNGNKINGSSQCIKNNPKSNYAKICSTKGPGRHGIEFRVFATRVGFKIFEKEERYQVTFRVDVIIGFSYSEYTIKFGKIIKASGKYSKDGYLWLLNEEEMSPILLTILIGNSENKFAVIIDELNNKVYDYGRTVLADLGEKSIQEILNKDGALAMIGPDMNLHEEKIDENTIDIIFVAQKGCQAILNLTLNNEFMNKRFDCYKRSRNHCDYYGLEEYNKLKIAFDELNELIKTCPCDYVPRPSHIIDPWLYPDPKSRNKRSVNVSLKIGESDAYQLVNGCENATQIAFGDVFLNFKDINEAKERVKKCCNDRSRNKRQLHSTSQAILWRMPIYYAFGDDIFGARLCCGSRLMPIVITADSDTDILFMKEGKGFARIRYQSVLKPSIEASNCKEVRESILDLQSHPHASGLKNYVDQKESEPVNGPYFGFICDGDKKLLVNGRYYVQKWGCIDPPDKGCGYILELFCRKVEGYNESNWYWLNPKYEWILSSTISCHPQKDTEFNKK
uniref:Uncharacterized protein n=1 Tax=Meloidogyne hapla TaxID=6305 RepID=A0A1I8B7I3_MELHA